MGLNADAGGGAIGWKAGAEGADGRGAGGGGAKPLVGGICGDGRKPGAAIGAAAIGAAAIGAAAIGA